MNDGEFLRIVRETRVLITIITRFSEHSLDRRLSDCNVGVSSLQLGVLRKLHREEGTLSDLSRYLLLDPSTLVPVIDALERKGYISRHRDPNDRRRVPLTLTEEGYKVIAGIPMVDEDDLLVQSLRSLGVERATTLLECLRDLMIRMPNGEHILNEVEARVHSANELKPAAATAPPVPDRRRRLARRSMRRRPAHSDES